MSKRILVTGGAGFIGSHLVDDLIKQGHKVSVYDNLDPQVHIGKKPAYTNLKAGYIYKDILDRDALSSALNDADVVFHEAAAVGVGQSMYQIQKYVNVNTLGTANLLDILVNDAHNVKKLIVASSMSIYGEGKYNCDECGIVYPLSRPEKQLKNKQWYMCCPKCGKTAKPLPTDETKPLHSTSIYAITKKDQEEMCLTIGKAYGIPTVALRYFNAYGPRQALSNPYTGVCAIFSCRIRNNKPPLIFEDGMQSRDFVSVYDIVAANSLVMEKSKANYESYNVGTGKPITIRKIADLMIGLYGKKTEPKITNKYREGDIKHCSADITKLRRLGYNPTSNIKEGMQELTEWVNAQPSCNVKDKLRNANKELEKHRLTY
jgi:dTDP-L-rhamnose 4-epimerase|tara:strand:- start:715 stop:1839 length:1125 start_codon:yes stop_codon:yes gene_type:complete